MKTRIQSILLACLALMGFIVTSCTDTALVEMSDNRGTDRPFALTVHPSASDSRLALGADGLTTEWEPGDKLVLVDKNRMLAPIYLSCTLTEKAKTATFVSESGVPAGTYYVIYNYNDYLAYGHKPFQSIQDINDHDDLVLYNELTITEGASTASLSLNHLYAKVKVTLKNVPTDVSEFQVGMYSPKKGFPMYLNFTSTGLVNAEYGINPNSLNYTSDNTHFPSNRRYHNVRLGNYSSTYDSSTGEPTYDFSKAKELSALVLPAELNDEDVFFYVLSDSESKAKCYEIKKQNINLQAGTSYKVELDLNEATESELTMTYDSNSYSYIAQLTDAKDWRHAAYRNGTLGYSFLYTYQIANDIDFQGEPFFPLSIGNIIGDNKTLSNIQLDWPDEDNVGLVRREWDYSREGGMTNLSPINRSTQISNLTLENVTFKGNNYVGAFGGWNIEATNCKVLGASVIEGQGDNVGGIVGCNRFDGSSSYKLADVQVGQSCQVQGRNYVGGIVGRYASSSLWSSDISNSSSSIMWLESCQSKATVIASGDYAGGIFGKMGGRWMSNGATSTSVSFSMEDKTFSLLKCVNEGKVSGRHYVGGIGGEFAMCYTGSSNVVDRVVLSQSCSNAEVSGNSKVGGILGSTQASTVLCYSTGTVTASSTTVGGVVGDVSGGYGNRIANCYSLAPLSVGTGGHAGGIVGTIGMNSVVNCYYAANPATYTYGGIVGNSGGSTTVKNCLTTLASLGYNLGEHKIRTGCSDDDNDGLPDWDYNNDGKLDENDLYYFYNDEVTDSEYSVTSILDKISVINGDNAYSTNTWDETSYPWKCVKFASFSADTNAPEFDEDTL